MLILFYLFILFLFHLKQKQKKYQTFLQIVRLKKSVKYDLPLQLGYFVYQQAKLKMLSFYFDVVDRFVDRRNFSLLEMDTGRSINQRLMN